MGIKVTVNSAPKNRISINNQSRQSIRTVGIAPDVTSLTTLDSLSDVDASNPDNNETLVYDAETGKYVVKGLPSVDGGTF